MAPEVCCIVPTHNRKESLLKTLAHIYGSEAVDLRCVVVFDGCTDGSEAKVALRFPEVIRVLGDGSLWWSGAINAGLRAASQTGCSFYCLFNDDVVPDPHMLERLLSTARAHPGTVVGPRIEFFGRPGTIWCAGGNINWWRQGLFMQRNGCPVQDNELVSARWLPGMGTLVEASIMDRHGLLDARTFPQYFGDADWSLRLNRRGVPILVEQKAVLYNDVSLTGVLLGDLLSFKQAVDIFFSRRSHANVASRVRFWGRHCPWFLVPFQIVRFYLPLAMAIFKRLVLSRAT